MNLYTLSCADIIHLLISLTFYAYSANSVDFIRKKYFS